MINKPRAYDTTEVYTTTEQIPPGGYVLEIIKSEVTTLSNGSQQLIIGFDVKEGEKAGFFRKQFNEQDPKNRKWKGCQRLWVPTDNDEHDWSIKKFKSHMVAIEESNNGYSWDWNETSLKGKLVGGLFGLTEKEIDGRPIKFTECRQFCGIERIREGNFDIPKDRLLQDSNTSATQVTGGIPQGFSAVDDSDIPF